MIYCLGKLSNKLVVLVNIIINMFFLFFVVLMNFDDVFLRLLVVLVRRLKVRGVWYMF